MTHRLKTSFLEIILFFMILLLSIGCSTVKEAIHPTEKTAPPSGPVQNGDYKGPKVKVLITKFVDKSSSLKNSGQTEDSIEEMLGNALLATNRFTIQMHLARNESKQSIKGSDLLIGGTITQFEPGKGLIFKTPSHITFLLNVSDAKTGRKIISRNMEGKGAPLEKAIQMAIEESVKVIVAKTPSEYYRISPAPTPSPPPPSQEATKPPTKQSEVTSLPPANPTVKPTNQLRSIQIVWSYVNLRNGPGTDYRNVGSIKKGTSLGLLEDRGDWLRVRLQNGKEVWVNRQATTLADNSQPLPSSTPAQPSAPAKPNPM
jgi:curli biogenesis system outer membrane secretion channel CsgG